MSQVITNAFEQYWQSSLAAEQPVVLDEFVLADIPNLDITSPIDPDTGLPPAGQIVYRQDVDQRGRINNNAVAYSIVMDTSVGDFSFNAMYLRNKANGVIGMIVYKGRETKTKTDQTTGQTGNSLVKSMLMGYDQAAEATLTNVDAGTWQIDYAARLRGQDEDLRQLASQLYGHHTFIGDGFKAVQEGATYKVTQGVAIVGGLRIELHQPETIYPGTKPIGVWVDVYRSGSLLSEHQNHFTIITSVADLTDHLDGNGYQHYVAKLAIVQADSTVVDGRGLGGAGSVGPGVMTRGVDKFSIMQGRSGEYRQDTLTRGLSIELNEPITGSGFNGATNTYMFNRLLIADDRVDAQNDATAGTKVDGMIVQHNFGGPGARGGRHAAEFMLTQKGATESDNTDRNYVGVVGYCATTTGDGGTDTGSGKKGAYFGGNFFTTIKNAQFVSHANGCESNVFIDAASNVGYRTAYSAVSGGEKQADKYDAGFAVGALGVTGAQWKDGLLIGIQNGRNPVSRSMIRGETLSIPSIMSFSGAIPAGIITSDTDTRFNFGVDRLEMYYSNASLNIGAKTVTNTPYIRSYTDDTGLYSGQIIFSGSAASGQGNGVCNIQYRQTTVKEIVPSAAATYSCGTAALPWSGGFSQAAFTVTSDEHSKTELLSITDDILDAWQEVDLAQYQYLDRVEAKGVDGARWHFGTGARRVVDVFARHGLDAHRFAFICYDEWEAQYRQEQTNEGAMVTKTRIVQCPDVEIIQRQVAVEIEQEDGTIVTEVVTRDATIPKLELVYLDNEDGTPKFNDDGTRASAYEQVIVDVVEEYEEFAEPEYIEVLDFPAGSRYGIRYEEALVLEAALQRRNNERALKMTEELKSSLVLLTERIETLEAA